jgi:hypothetical protein
MRGPAKRGRGRARKSTLKNVSAPLLGWDLTAFGKETGVDAAFELQNYVPEVGKVTLRQGSEDHVTGITGPVGTLMEYTFGAVSQLFAANAGNIYNVTSAGSVGAAVVTGLANGNWGHLNFSTTGGNFLCIVNGADGFHTWNGSAWAEQTITGVDADDIVDLFNHKERIWMIEDQSLSAWYLPSRAIAGAAVEFDIGSIVTKGGKIMAGGSWSFDGGSGPDDYLVLITSEGEVVIFSGVDPSSVTTWALVGVYQIDRPIGRRCLIDAGSDMVILTESGTIPLREVQISVSSRDAVPDAIRDAFLAATAAAGTTLGWQLYHYRKKGWLFANIPFTSGSRQYAINSVTKRWFEIQGWDADCWGSLSGSMYFAIPGGTIVKADSSKADIGADIVGRIVTGWDDFGTDYLKHWKMVRPLLQSSERFTPFIRMLSDYDLSRANGTAGSFSATVGAVWDVAVWDVAEWISTSAGRNLWYGVGGSGQVGSIYYESRTSNIDISLSGWDVLFEPGEVL